MGVLKFVGFLLILIVVLVMLEARKGGRSRGQGRRQQSRHYHRSRSKPRTPEVYYPPISGQRVRLNGFENRTKSSGNVEVFLRNKWGMVCDDDWNVQEANVVCKQLGYMSGAASFTTNSHFGQGLWNNSDILMDDVDCSGTEKSLTECRYEHLSNCHPAEGAGVNCRPNTGCPANWVAGPESCYFLSNITTTKREFAANKCKKLGGYLVNIETEEENHFLSNTFVRDIGEPIITGALKKKKHWFWEKVLRTGQDQELPVIPDLSQLEANIGDGLASEFENAFENYLRTQLLASRKKRSPRRNGPKQQRRNSNTQTRRNSQSHTVVSSETRIQTSVEFFKWFSGWIPGNKMKEPTNKKNTKCIYLKSIFPHPDKSVREKDVEYLFWDDEICKRTSKRLRNGFRFLCERPRYIQDEDIDVDEMENNIEQPGEERDCYTGNGHTYRGKHSSTERGTPCIPWSLATRNQEPSKRINLNHNYCRNPDNDTRPWCFVDEDFNFGFCPILECAEVASVLTTLPPTTVASMAECPDTEFYCRNTNKCIAKSWHCDMESDCDGAEDEQGCDYKILQFKKLPNSKLEEAVIRETFTRISNETCAQYCLNREEYVCRSFGYKREGRVCSLSDTNTQISGAPAHDDETNVFELMSQTLSCEGMFTCDNGRCIKLSLLCNHDDECGDFSDETNCWQDEPTEVRLVDGGETSGRVEVKHLGQWGTICDDQWDADDAAVVCKMLGYASGKAKATSNSKYGPGNGKFFLDEVQCTGNEASIDECNHSGWKQHDCRPHETAGVECETRKACSKDQYTCSTGQCLEATSVCNGICDCRPNCTDENGNGEFNCQSISLEVPGVVSLNGKSVAGRVEIVKNGLRGTVCDDSWDSRDATVLCRMLGYRYGRALSGKVVEDGTGPIWLDEVDCDGTENSLLECNLGSWGVSDCDHAEDAGVRCSNESLPEDPVLDREKRLRVQLVDGNTPNEGRVEVIKDGKRGTICDDSWDTFDASVVCRMLGYIGGIPKIEAHFGPGSASLPILLDDVGCTGLELSLSECSHPGWGVSDCAHGEDAGVVCLTSGNGDDVGGNLDFLNPSVPCGRRPIQTNSRKKREEPELDNIRELAEVPKLERIIGGFTAAQGFYPWQVGVRIHAGFGMYTHWCGGTIIHDNWIVSAAHCFVDTHKSQIRLRTGDHDNKVKDLYEEEFEAELIINHEGFDENTLDNDIALIKVQPSITFSDHVQPACLPEPTTSYVEGQKCHVSGWGRTEKGYQNMLKAAKVPIVSDRTCRRAYSFKVTANMVCAGYLEGGIDTCSGDSGGPLVCPINGKYILMGATSFGAECAEANAPGVYAKITRFLPWIKQKIGRYS